MKKQTFTVVIEVTYEGYSGSLTPDAVKEDIAVSSFRIEPFIFTTEVISVEVTK